MKEHIVALTKILNALAPQKQTEDTIREMRKDGCDETYIFKSLVGSLADWIYHGN